MKKISLVCLIAILSLCISFLFACGSEEQKSEKEKAENYGFGPIITVDFGEYSEDDLPVAVKGTQYRLFGCSAQDIYGNEVDVDTKVYLHYYSEVSFAVAIDNGCFNAEHYGVYSVVHSAKDSFDNESVYHYDVLCAERETIRSSFDF